MAKFVVGEKVWVRMTNSECVIAEIDPTRWDAVNQRSRVAYRMEGETWWKWEELLVPLAKRTPQTTLDAQRQSRLEYVQAMRENGAWWYGRQGIGWN